MKTCAKHTVRFWDYIGDRLEVPEAPAVPRLAELNGQPLHCNGPSLLPVFHVFIVKILYNHFVNCREKS